MTRSDPEPTVQSNDRNDAEPTRGHRLDAMFTLAWILAAGFVCSWMIPLEASLLEEGYIVHIAQRLAAGEVLYRDIVTFTGPLPFEALGLLFQIFGEQIEVARWSVVVLHALGCGAGFKLADAAAGRPVAHASACVLACAPVLLFPLYSMYFYSTLAGSLVYIAGYAALRGLRSTPWAITAGALIAGVALTKQTVGAVSALALLGAFVAASRSTRIQTTLRGALAFTAGGLAVAAGTLVVYAAAGDLEALYRSLVVLPFSLQETFNAPYINFWPLGSMPPDIYSKRAFYLPYIYVLLTRDYEDTGALIILLTQLLFALPFVSVAVTAVAALRRRLSPEALIHTAVFAAVATNLYPRTDWGHLVFALPAAAIQVLILMGSVLPTRFPMRFAKRLSPIVLIALLLFGTWSQGRLLHRVTEQGSWGPHVKQRPISRYMRGDQIPAVIRYIRGRTDPGDPIFVARSEPLIYFATDTTNPTPYGGVIPGLQAEQQAAILSGLPGVRYVVMSEIDQPFFTYYRDELPDVEAYFERFFRVAPPFEFKQTWLVVLERGTDRGPTAIDLMSPDAKVRAFVRNEAGPLAPVVDPDPAEVAKLPKLPNRLNRRPYPFVLGRFGGGLDYEITIPDGGRLQVSLGRAEFDAILDSWKQPRNSTVVTSISRGNGFEELTRTPILTSKRDDRHWIPLELDLSDRAGETVTLRLELRSDTETDGKTIGWFGSPRIALPAPAGPLEPDIDG